MGMLLGCRSHDEPPPSKRDPPAQIKPKPEATPKPTIEGRFVIEMRADDHVTVHIEGNPEGTYADGPSLQAALERIRKSRPDLAKHATVQLPLVFGYEAPQEFWDAIGAAGYESLFGATIGAARNDG